MHTELQRLAYIRQRINDRDKRDWTKLPQSFEVDTVRAAFGDVKGLLDKRDIRERIRASKATTFEELRNALTHNP